MKVNNIFDKITVLQTENQTKKNIKRELYPIRYINGMFHDICLKMPRKFADAPNDAIAIDLYNQFETMYLEMIYEINKISEYKKIFMKSDKELNNILYNINGFIGKTNSYIYGINRSITSLKSDYMKQGQNSTLTKEIMKLKLFNQLQEIGLTYDSKNITSTINNLKNRTR